MEIPHKIQVKKGIWYYVVYVDKFDDPNQLGMCIDAEPPICPGARTIQILKSLSKKKKLEIFHHELLHALEMEYDLKVPHSAIYELQRPLALLSSLNQELGSPLLSGAAARRRRKSQRRKGLRKKRR